MASQNSIATFATVIAAVVVLAGCASPTQWRKDRQAAFDGNGKTKGAAKVTTTKKRKRVTRTQRTLDKLAETLDAKSLPIENTCLNTLCTRHALDRSFQALDELDKHKEGKMRILQLGDSHIAADYITRTIRKRLQERFGNAGRGFVAIDQRAPYGGRRLQRKGWKRRRIVDEGAQGRPFGFSGMELISTRSGAEAKYRLAAEDDQLAVYYHGHWRGARLKIYAENEQIATLNTRSRKSKSRVRRFDIPEHALGGATAPAWMRVVAMGTGARLFGLSFESNEPGVILDSIGPVGADANVYLSLDQKSLKAHLRALEPTLVVLMIGGNDALAIRKGRRTVEQVKIAHEKLIDAIRKHVPQSDCLLFGPMDAGEQLEDGTIITKSHLLEIRDLQREVAKEKGCAFWDTLDAMGGEGSFGRWHAAGIMNDDMVHPRSKGGDLIGHLFATALMKAYLGN